MSSENLDFEVSSADPMAFSVALLEKFNKIYGARLLQYELCTVTVAAPSYCSGHLVTFVITIGCNFIVKMIFWGKKKEA